MAARNLCPVCGYPDLLEPAWEGDSPSYDICSSCGTEFGYQDFGPDISARRARWRELREAWRAAGYPWHFPPPPEGWDPEKQLKAVED